MKPDWSDSPSWAKWLSMDKDGSWWWSELQPIAGKKAWLYSEGQFAVADPKPVDIDWQSTSEFRP